MIDRSEILLLDSKPENVKQNWAALAPLRNGWKENIEALERSLLKRALAEANGNKSKAAEALGIHRRLLYEKLRQYGLEWKEDF